MGQELSRCPARAPGGRNKGSGQQMRVVTGGGYCLKKGREVGLCVCVSMGPVPRLLNLSGRRGPTASSPTVLRATAHQEGSAGPLVWGVGVTHWYDGELHEETS